ncbi:hypothetical protein I6M64_05675 [Acinetobacter lactucae]|uniref:Uncharacterized protein n=1 Tax=Acinetobacter lactucae TaxID=1785128 RepID=A0ABS1AG12_9GAMM|nr:hypothetical protein [Acinetobacter lactucae]MBJ8436813.1 hypothetical protein [Acinetobacter lactucae]
MIDVVHEPHVINDLDDVVALLKEALNDQLDHYELRVADLEKFSMHLTGEKFHQTITPSLMKGFIDLQNAIYRSYAQIKYNEPTILKLSKEEKDELELEVKVINGSSGFEVNVQELFEKLITLLAGKMTSKHIFILVLSTILLYGGYEAHSNYLENQKEIRMAEIALEKDVSAKQERLATVALLSDRDEDDTKDILAQAAKFAPQVNNIKEEANNASHSLIKSAQAADSIDFDNGKIKLTGEAAKELTKTSPNKWNDVRIDGVYHVVNVDSSHSAKRKIRIRNIETQQEILAVLENDTLDQKNLNLIQEAEWGYNPVFLKVRAKELNNTFKEAQILEAKELKQ